MKRKPKRTAIVTGAGRGIGRAVAIALAREGFSLCLSARNRDELEETRRLTELAPNHSLIVLIDLAEPDAPELLISTTREHFGRIDAIVNTARSASNDRTARTFDEARIDEILAVNLRAPIAIASIAPSAMNAGGAIVNVTVNHRPSDHGIGTVEAAAVSGLRAFTRSAAPKFRKDGIRLSAIIAGAVKTSRKANRKRGARDAAPMYDDIVEAVFSVLNAPARRCPVEIEVPSSRRVRPRA